jgi:ABC-type antimicrobial peptide transport system permease subunit
MDGVIEAGTWAFGLFGSLFMIFGTVALFMSAVGLYGVMAFSVSRRTQEMGIRMALGAYGKDIVRLVLKKGLVQLALGMAIGLGAGVAMSRPLQFVMFEVNPRDPFVYATIVGVLGLAGLLACLVPARRATRVDLVDALRPE